MNRWIVQGAGFVGMVLGGLVGARWWRKRRESVIEKVVLTEAVRQRAARRADAARKVLASYRAAFDAAAKSAGVRPAVLMAIAMRETNGTNIMGDGGHGHGMMQIDDRSFPEWTRQWKASGMPVDDNIRKGAAVLASKRAYVESKRPDLPAGDLEYASIAAYNTGEGNVVKSIAAGRSPDATTTGGDYAAEVLEIARLLA